MKKTTTYSSIFRRGFFIRTAIISVFILFFEHGSYAQSSTRLSRNEQILEELIEWADSCGKAGLFKEVIAIAQSASKMVRNPERYRSPYYQLKTCEALALMSLDEPDYERAIPILKEIEKNLPEIASYCHSELGRAFWAIGRYEKAIPYLEQAINEMVSQDSTDVYSLLSSKEMLASAYKNLGDNDMAAEIMCSFFGEQVDLLSHEAFQQLLLYSYNDLIAGDANPSYDKGTLHIIQELAKYAKDNNTSWYVYLEGQISVIAQVLGDFALAYKSAMEGINNYTEKCDYPIWQFYGFAAAASSRLGEYKEAHHLLDLMTELISKENDEEIKAVWRKKILSYRTTFYLDEGVNIDIAISNLEYLLDDNSLSPEDRATYLYNLGQAYGYINDVKAEEAYNRALEYYEITEGHGVLYAKTINQLGAISMRDGLHDNAMKYFELAIDIFKRRSDKGNYSYALVLGNAAMCANKLGQYGRAVAWGEESCRIQSDFIGYMYPHVWTTLLSAYSRLGDTDEYERVFNEYATISQLDPCERFNYQFQSTNSLYNQGDVEGALASMPILDSLYYSIPDNLRTRFEYDINSITDKLFPGNNDVFLFYANHLSQIDSLNRLSKNFLRSLGYECQRNNDYISANTLFKLSYEQGPLDYDFLYSSIEAAALSGDVEFGRRLKKDAVTFVNSQYENVIGLTENEKEYYWQNVRNLQNLLFYYRADSKSDKTLFDILLKTKNFLLRSNIFLLNYLQNSGNTILVKACNELKLTRKLISDTQRTATPQVLDSLRLKEIAINRDIVKNIKQLSDFDICGDLTYEDVSNSLREGEVAIEIFDYPTQEGFIAYAAFIVSKGADHPIFVALCNENEIENFIGVDSHKLYDINMPFSSQLYDLFWKPLMPYIPIGSHVYLSTEGLFSILALEAISIDETHYVNDVVSVSRLTTTAELCNTTFSSSMSNATVFGGINYKVSSITSDVDVPTYSESAYLLARSTVGELSYLPNTKIEAERITKILTNEHITTQLHIGQEGTEEAFKSLSGQEVSIIHISTHGFYIPKDKLSKTRFFEECGPTVPVSTLQRSGLLLAGSEPAWNGKLVTCHEDGILTASEISGLDFSTTQLVVMSACESGLGDITDDGVAGLQRGFKNSGVHSIVMSLWPVDDKATAILMITFYKNLAKGMSTSKSLLDAKAQLRKQKKYRNPYYWASFILLD